MFSAQLYEEQCDKVESLTQDYEDRIVDLSERLEHSESLIQAAQQECEQRDEQIQSLNHTVQQVDQLRIIFWDVSSCSPSQGNKGAFKSILSESLGKFNQSFGL